MEPYVEVRKITDFDLMNEFASVTIFKDTTNPDPYRMYEAGHSPIRTQLFVVILRNIPTFLHVHLRTHSIGILHCVKTNREDRVFAYTGDGGRDHPVNHDMLLNADSFISMAKRRFCHQAHAKTRYIMRLIHEQLQILDPALAMAMKPMCLYRGGICHEHKCCGKIPGVIHSSSSKAPDLTYTFEPLDHNPMDDIKPETEQMAEIHAKFLRGETLEQEEIGFLLRAVEQKA